MTLSDFGNTIRLLKEAFMITNQCIPLQYKNINLQQLLFDYHAIELLQLLLRTRNEFSKIYICFPEHILDRMIVDFNTKNVKAVDFNSINVEKMLRYADFGCYTSDDKNCSETNNPLNYLFNRAVHMIKKYRKYGTPQFSYPLVVLEATPTATGLTEYFIRGIISWHQNSFSVALNPSIHNSIIKEPAIQKSLNIRKKGNN